jgi:hypothetical protein
MPARRRHHAKEAREERVAHRRHRRAAARLLLSFHPSVRPAGHDLAKAPQIFARKRQSDRTASTFSATPPAAT